MHSGFPGYLGNGYEPQGLEGEPRYRRRRGAGGRHCSFQILYDNISSYSSSSQARQLPIEWASSTMWEELDDTHFQSYSQIGIHEEMIKAALDSVCEKFGQLLYKAYDKVPRSAMESSKKWKVSIQEKVDVIISEWMGYMLLYELYMVPVTHSERYCDSIVSGVMSMELILYLLKFCAWPLGFLCLGSLVPTAASLVIVVASSVSSVVWPFPCFDASVPCRPPWFLRLLLRFPWLLLWFPSWISLLTLISFSYWCVPASTSPGHCPFFLLLDLSIGAFDFHDTVTLNSIGFKITLLIFTLNALVFGFLKCNI
ncbi:hypothetical protein KFK09_014843 [Dendrobium nobile]|uniref:Uncharacterized protein n=1 Tax=Dendrobium nobile TaxID=94219 RepID=A0A8T3B520_DENNO|nr:hypothetical protein KFK09_014843 [Dendrobium nobile]